MLGLQSRLKSASKTISAVITEHRESCNLRQVGNFIASLRYFSAFFVIEQHVLA